ncbi:MAG: hypothetical protein ACRDVP_08725, partial [Acidimicrobiales bacterium]
VVRFAAFLAGARLVARFAAFLAGARLVVRFAALRAGARLVVRFAALRAGARLAVVRFFAVTTGCTSLEGSSLTRGEACELPTTDVIGSRIAAPVA